MSIHYRDDQVTLLLGDALDQLRTLPDESVDCIVTSPPYYAQRDYGTEGQYGLEDNPAEFVATLRAVFTEARRVLADDGTLWLNLGDSYGSSEVRPVPGPRKGLALVPERVAIALADDGWILRNKNIWHKTGGTPDPVRDRLANRHETIYLAVRSERYWFDLDAIREPAKSPTAGKTWDQRKASGAARARGVNAAGQQSVPSLAPHPKGVNPGDVWSMPTARFKGAHFAVMPIDLAFRCIQAGCRPGGTVLDMFSGSGTTGAAALLLDRRYIGIDNKAAYHDLAIKERFAQGVFELDTA